MMNSVQAWLLLRRPFPLTSRCTAEHVCEWERIDIDKTGCVLCSDIHVCSFGNCTSVTQTEDSLVCNITGLCIRKDNIVVSGYSDEVISYGCSEVYTGDYKRVEYYEGVDVYVKELLLSDQAQRVHVVERKHYIAKLTNRMQKLMGKEPHSKHAVSVIGLIEGTMRANTDRKGYTSFNRARREYITGLCTQQLRSTLPICNRFLKMNIKRTDMRSAVFGLLFLMRSGIQIHDICVLPSIPELLEFLPNESNLLKFFDFKSKTITEIENKFKYHLRHADRQQMHNMGFHISRQGVSNRALK